MARPILRHRTIKSSDRNTFINYLDECHNRVKEIREHMLISHGPKDLDVMQLKTMLSKLTQIKLAVVAIPETKQ